MKRKRKLAEANRKSSEIERKLKEIEARESSLRIERNTFAAEREAIWSNWERIQLESSEMLIDDQRVINHRKDKANERDLLLQQKEKELAALEEKLNARERGCGEFDVIHVMGIRSQWSNLTVMAKETDIGRHVNLLKRHPSNEVRRIAKLLVSKCKYLLDAWTKDNSLGENAPSTFSADGDSPQQNPPRNIQNGIHQEEIQKLVERCNHQEELLLKEREDLKQERKNFEKKWEVLDEREKTIKVEEKNLDLMKKMIDAYIESLQNLIADLEKKMADVKAEQV